MKHLLVACGACLAVLFFVPSPVQADIEDCWAGGGAPNHCDRTTDMRYDIWQANCHTAANVAVCNSPHDTGIIICGGNPQGPGNPGDHTFNYVITRNPDGTTTTSYWNWGISCGPCNGPPPANFGGQDCHSRCVARWCNTQYDGGTDEACLPLGEMVEIPGPSVCVTEVSNANGGSFDPSLVGDCKACCDTRANTWPNEPGYCQRGVDSEDFRAACKYLCEGFFENGHPGGIIEPVACPYYPSVMACQNGAPTTLASIQQQCAALGYADPSGSPEERRCYSDCVSNTLAAQAGGCAGAPPPTATCSYFPSVMACEVGGTATSQTQIETDCAALSYADPLGTDEEVACYQDCVANTQAAQSGCDGGASPPPMP